MSPVSDETTPNTITTKPTVALLDARNRDTGGIKSLNDDLERSILKERFRFVRSGLMELNDLMREECAAGRPLICIFDESFRWSSLPRVFAARMERARLSLKTRGWTCRFIGREHHYTRSFVTHCVPNQTRFELMLRAAYLMMDRVIAVSQGQADWIRDRNLCPAAKLHPVIHTVDIEPLLKIPIRTPGTSVVFGSMGRFTFQKAIGVLLDAWALLPAGCDAKLVIGGFGPEEDALREQARNLRGVTFVGRVTDRASFLAGCDAMIMPSRYEPGAQVCIESRAAALPLIASDVDCFYEQPRDCRLLFKSGDPVELKDRILEMCEIVAQGRYPAIAATARWSAEEADKAYYPKFASTLDSLL
jgi:glycosyltransferase involved in cell wall biosynthesis